MLSAIKQMELYSQKYPDVISLSQGIPGTSSDALIKYGVMQALMSNQVDTYSTPAGLRILRKAVSEKLSKNGMDYTADEIVITAGATEAMTATLLSLTKPGDEVLIPTPTYSAFLRSAKTARLTIREIPLVEERNWQLDLEQVRRKISSRTKAIVLCNPNNPTGTIYNKGTLLQVIELALAKNIYVIIDEVYRNMVYADEETYNLCTESKYKNNIVRIVSFSKDFSLTGWRVGFLHSNSEIIERILPVHDSLINCAPVISQHAALAALKYDKQIIADNKKTYILNKEIVEETLEKLSDHFSFIPPQGSYFFFPKLLHEKDSMKFCLDLLEKERLALVPGSDFGSGGEGHIRICFGRNTEAVNEGMKRLGRYFRKDNN